MPKARLLATLTRRRLTLHTPYTVLVDDSNFLAS